MKRQYPCGNVAQSYQLELFKDGVKIDTAKFSTTEGFGFIRQIDLPPGKYQVKAGMQPGQKITATDYPYDFTLSVYAKDYIPITDDKGQKSEDLNIYLYDSGNIIP